MFSVCSANTLAKIKPINKPVFKNVSSIQLNSRFLDYIVIQRSNDQIGFKNDSENRLNTASAFAIVSDISNLSWIVIRGGTGFNFSSQEKYTSQLPIVLESNSIKTKQDSMWINSDINNKNNWIRLYYRQNQSDSDYRYGDVILFIDQNKKQNAILGLQNAKDHNIWSIFELPDYGSWLMNEINITIRLTTGL